MKDVFPGKELSLSRYKPSDYETRTPLFGFRRIADRLRPLPVTSLRRNRHGRPLPDHRRRNGPATPVRNQAKSGTCWAFGGVSLIESEAIRTRRCTLDLSEMWVVRHAYFEKAVKYVRTRGRVAFDQGGEIQDVLWLVDRYGIVLNPSTKAERPTAPTTTPRWRRRSGGLGEADRRQKTV